MQILHGHSLFKLLTCHWLAMRYTRKKNCIGEITIKKNNNKKTSSQVAYHR